MNKFGFLISQILHVYASLFGDDTLSFALAGKGVAMSVNT